MSCLTAQWLGTRGANMAVNFMAGENDESIEIQRSGHGHSQASA